LSIEPAPLAVFILSAWRNARLVARPPACLPTYLAGLHGRRQEEKFPEPKMWTDMRKQAATTAMNVFGYGDREGRSHA
jgi:hypothetical protein